MDKSISVGDLVQIIATSSCTCPAESKATGHVFTVTEIRHVPGKCIECGAPMDGLAAKGHPWGWCEMFRLKRIPPLGDIDGKKDAADKPIALDGEIERLRKMVSA